MQTQFQTDTIGQSILPASGISKIRLWTGRILTALVALFLLLDAAGKFAMPAQVVEAFARLGFPVALGFTLGTVLTLCTVLYAIPRTSVLGAVLVTGYLGGAVSIQMRAGSPLFETLFPIVFGVLAWAGVCLRDARLSALLPLLSKPKPTRI